MTTTPNEPSGEVILSQLRKALLAADNIDEIANMMDDVVSELGDGYFSPADSAGLRELADILRALPPIPKTEETA